MLQRQNKYYIFNAVNSNNKGYATINREKHELHKKR